MKVIIRDFQSLKDTSVEVEGLTVLVGPSHRGKSAFIRAVEGALFNRPGDQFVRTGASKAVVSIEALPTLQGPPLSLTWTKGKNANDYVIDGTAYGRVGTGAPAPLAEAGYRDVWIGDKERKKGSYIRPQVATQFEPLFLLTQTGSFISDVLSVISRHAVLLTAQGRCGSDLKSVKHLLGVRRTDREAEGAKLAALDAVPAFVARVKALVEEARKVEAARAAVERLRGLVARRRAALPVAGLPVPPLTSIDPAFAARQQVAEVGWRVQARAKLVRAASQRPPVATVVRDDLGATGMVGRQLATKRGLLLRTIRPLPVTRVAEVPEVLRRTEARCQQAAGLAQAHRRLFDVVARQLPKAYAEKVPRIVPWQEKAATLHTLTGRRIMHLAQVQRAEAAQHSIVTETERVEAELAEAFGALDVCPLCEQEIAHVHA